MEKLNTLAFPKGKTPMCEITGQPSSVQLVTPYITLFFATREDALSSWEGIMYKLCPLLGPLRDEPEVIGSEEDRKRRKRTYDMSVRALIDITSEESSKLLRENKPHLAIPAALQALKFTREVYVVFECKFESPYFFLLSRECHSNHLCHSFIITRISLQHQHSNIPSIIAKYLIRASRSNTGMERVA